MSIQKEIFGKTKDGKEAFLYTLTNDNGLKVQVTNYGGILVRLFVPDKAGNVEDVVLGYDNLEGYLTDGGCFGATVGPNANRIENACFELNGKKYELAKNDGNNNLHSDFDLGYQRRLFDAKVDEDNNAVILSLKDPDMNMGFPGNKDVSVTYTLTDKNEVKIHYYVTTDCDTIVNMTNHSYFNLAGHKAGYIGDHVLKLHASQYTPDKKGAIPTGEIVPVQGTPMDFTAGKKIDQDIHEDFEQINLTGGYDHNWIIDGSPRELRIAAEVTEPTSGRKMLVYTDMPGIQFYAGNFIDNKPGKENFVYDKRYGLALETQFYPNTANQENFPSAVATKDKPFDSTTIYQFV